LSCEHIFLPRIWAFKKLVMGHVICSVKTGPNQSIVKLNLFNYFEKKSKVALNKYEKAVERSNEIILHFATHPRHCRYFLSPNRNLQPN
jgi:proteasome lid subunit RPN8/RPN11